MADEIVSRADARARGLKYYFTGEPCPKGHIAERYVSNLHCIACDRDHAAISNAKRQAETIARNAASRTSRQEKFDRPIVTRPEAKAAGLLRYFTGVPCDHGHIAERLTSSGGCFDCSKRIYDAWRAANPEKYKASYRNWQAENREFMKERYAKYYAANAEWLRERAKDWRIANPERASAKDAAWRAANPEKVREQGRTRRARERNAEGSHTVEDIKSIYAAQKGKCACCGRKVGDVFQIDHIQPLSKGGRNDRRNLQITCPECNWSKHARDPVEFMRSLGRLL